MNASRTRTNSEVKWLANELAMVAGELEKVDREFRRLAERRASLKATREALSRVAALAAVPELPSMVPPVRAHHPYGGRGNLRNFLRDVLKAAYPGALDTRTLAELALRHFWDTFESDTQREYFRRKRVTHTLRKLVDLGEVERLHQHVTTQVGGWRIRDAQPSLVELTAMSADRVEV